MILENSIMVMGIFKVRILEAKNKLNPEAMCVGRVNLEENFCEARNKTSEETILVAMDKLISEAKRIEGLNTYAIFEKDLTIEEKGLEVICMEKTNFEVKGKTIFKNMGNMIFEVEHLELKNNEEVNLEGKNGLEAMGFEVTINKVMGKRFIGVMGKMIFEVLCLEFVDNRKAIIETKGNMFFVSNCFGINGIKVAILGMQGKATILEASSIGKQGIEQTTFKAMGMARIIGTKGM